MSNKTSERFTLNDWKNCKDYKTLFGDFLEGLAIFICQKVFNGKKSDLEGIDLEFTNGKVYYIVEIKSGPNWGNSSQTKKMKENFNKAKAALSKQSPTLEVKAINGCCYGKQSQSKDGYDKLCGQQFWQLISGSDTLYTEIIEPLGHQAQEHNKEFMTEYAKVVNTFTLAFAQRYCNGGEINWQKIVAFTSKNTQ